MKIVIGFKKWCLYWEFNLKRYGFNFKKFRIIYSRLGCELCHPFEHAIYRASPNEYSAVIGQEYEFAYSSLINSYHLIDPILLCRSCYKLVKDSKK